MRRILLIVAPLIAAVAQLRELEDPDLWWHLRGGAMVASQRRWWLDETGSFLQAGTWWNTEWLSQLFAFATHAAFGPAGLVVAIALSAAAAAWFVLRRLPDEALPLGVLAQLAIADHWAPRPQAALLVGLALALGMRTPSPVAWMALQLVWAHLHASHVLLPIVPAAWALDALVRRQDARGWLRVAIGCALVSVLLNPLGPSVLFEVVDHAGTEAARHIGDMRPPTLADLWPTAWGPHAAALILWALAASRLWTVRRADGGAVRDAVLFLLGTALALTAVRFRAPAALLWLPLASRAAGPGGAKLAMVALPLLLLHAQARPGPRWGLLGVRALHLPADAARVLADRSGVLWNHYDDGGYLGWRLPDWTITIDGRTPTWFTAESHRLWRQSKNSTSTFLALAESHGITAALVPRNLPLCAGLRDHPGWRAGYADLERVLFVPASSPIGTTIRALPLCADDPEPACDAAPLALREIEALDALAPGATYPRVARLRLGACTGDPAALADIAAERLEDDPGPDRMLAISALAAAGRSAEALRAVDDAERAFPDAEWSMMGVRISGGALAYWDEAARRFDDAMPLRLRVPYARALAAAGRNDEAADQALRAAWGRQADALALLETLPLDERGRDARARLRALDVPADPTPSVQATDRPTETSDPRP